MVRIATRTGSASSTAVVLGSVVSVCMGSRSEAMDMSDLAVVGVCRSVDAAFGAVRAVDFGGVSGVCAGSVRKAVELLPRCGG